MIAGPLTSMVKTSSTTRLSKNLLLLIDMAKVNEVGVSGDSNCEDETVERLLFKNSNRTIGYLTTNTRQGFT